VAGSGVPGSGVPGSGGPVDFFVKTASLDFHGALIG